LRPAAVTPEKVLAVATAAVGAVSVASALTPGLAARSEVVSGALPEGAMQLAGAATIAFGVALVWLSLALGRRKRRAWQLAVLVMLGTAVSHLVKGLDVEAAAASLAVLAALLSYRRRFEFDGDPESVRPLLFTVVALAAGGAVLVVSAADAVSLPDRVEDALAILTAALVFRCLYLWLRPLAAHLHEHELAREEAERIVGETGCDTLSFFALRDDKSYFFSPSGRSFLAYRVVHGVALVSGDPIGEEEEAGELIAEFRRVAQARGWRTAILASREELLPLHRSLGFKAIYLGDEAVVVPREFSLEGRPIRKVRQSVTRLERAGYRTRVLEVRDVDERLAAELRAVSAEWRGRWPERGFTMAMDGLFAYPEALVAVAEHEDGHVGGFIHLVPVPGTGGLSLASMRRRRSVPNGLMEFLLARTIEWARDRGVPEFSLNFSVFAQLIRQPGCWWRCSVRFALLRFDRLFQIDRLLRFNRKFFPEWRPRYICLESRLDFPLVGLAYLRAESLLTPPGPWARAGDLAAR
jgi:lysyl-tRNA synthetase, class II